jgi:hypothetical protein
MLISLVVEAVDMGRQGLTSVLAPSEGVGGESNPFPLTNCQPLLLMRKGAWEPLTTNQPLLMMGTVVMRKSKWVQGTTSTIGS